MKVGLNERFDKIKRSKLEVSINNKHLITPTFMLGMNK